MNIGHSVKEMTVQGVIAASSLERPTVSQHFVEDNPQGVNIRTRINGAAANNLR